MLHGVRRQDTDGGDRRRSRRSEEGEAGTLRRNTWSAVCRGGSARLWPELTGHDRYSVPKHGCPPHYRRERESERETQIEREHEAKSARERERERERQRETESP